MTIRKWITNLGVLLALSASAADAPFLGISVTVPTATLRHHLALEPGQGLVIASVQPDSPAAKAKLLPHDLILEIAGKPVGTEQQLIEVMSTLKPAQKVTCWVIQRGKHDVVDLIVGARPQAVQTQGPAGLQVFEFDLNLPTFTGQGQDTVVEGNVVRTMLMHVGTFGVDARQINGALNLVVRDHTGKVIFDGPVDDDKDAQELPTPVRKKLQEKDMLPRTVIAKPKK